MVCWHCDDAGLCICCVCCVMLGGVYQSGPCQWCLHRGRAVEQEKILQPFIDLELDDDELAWARSVGERMHRESVALGSEDHFVEGNEKEAHVIGASGELGWCKNFGIKWPARIGVYGQADIGKRIQIRTRTEYWHDLYVRPDGNPNHAYFLVIFTAPRFIRLHGWKWGHEVLSIPPVNLEKRYSEQKRNKPVHLAKQSSLRSIHAIPQELLDECF